MLLLLTFDTAAEPIQPFADSTDQGHRLWRIAKNGRFNSNAGPFVVATA
jgi:hypothetical protein